MRRHPLYLLRSSEINVSRLLVFMLEPQELEVYDNNTDTGVPLKILGFHRTNTNVTAHISGYITTHIEKNQIKIYRLCLLATSLAKDIAFISFIFRLRSLCSLDFYSKNDWL